MDNQNYGQDWGPKNPMMGTGEGEVPLAIPPQPKIDVRTLASDLQSIKDTGGGAPQSYTPSQIPEPIFPPPPFPAKPMGNVIVPPSIPSTSAPNTVLLEEESKPKKKGVFVIILGILIILGLGALGYFWVYPTFFSAPIVETQVSNPEPVSPQEPNEPNPPVIPPVTEPESGPLKTHLTFFKTPADATQELTLAMSTFAELKMAIPPESTDVPVLKEIVVKNSNMEFLTFPFLARQIFPSTISEQVGEMFENDFTFFVFSNDMGTWPGMIAKAKSSADLTQLKTSIALLEKSSEFSSFFISNPGTMNTWKDGKTSTATNRYVQFDQPGAAFNYGWAGNYLVLSTSYDAFKEAVKRTE